MMSSFNNLSHSPSTKERFNTRSGSNSESKFAEHVRVNQLKLVAELKSQYDFIVCGSGSAGSVVARRLAENPDVTVLLIEAGGSEDLSMCKEPGQWPAHLGSERNWGFQAPANPHLNGRVVQQNMARILGGGSSVNLMYWVRGHKEDWDFFASESGDPAWNYQSVLDIYRRVEDWHGAPDTEYRGTGGPIFIEPVQNPNPLAPAFVEGARSVGIPTFDSHNGRMMEGEGGASLLDVNIRDGMRQSVFRSYVFPYMDRPNLTVLAETLVSRVTFEGKKATGVEVLRNGSTLRIGAEFEVILSMGAIQTPKVLMQSGIGDQIELARFGIPLVQHLPGVGQNYQDHVGFGCIWEYKELIAPRNNMAEALLFWKSAPNLQAADIQICLGEIPVCSPETAAQFGLPQDSWTLYGCLARPKSRGQIRLTGSKPQDPLIVDPNMLAEPDDVRVAMRIVELAREVGNSAPLRPFVKREVMPGNLKGMELENFVRNAAMTYWHQTCSAKMGRDAMSVVDASLKVYGVERLRVADGSIMPRVTTGNTMAPCVVIGERAGDLLKVAHNF